MERGGRNEHLEQTSIAKTLPLTLDLVMEKHTQGLPQNIRITFDQWTAP